MSLITRATFWGKVVSGCVSRMSWVVQPSCSVFSLDISAGVKLRKLEAKGVCVFWLCPLGPSLLVRAQHVTPGTCNLQDKMIKGPSETWLFCVLLHSHILVSDLLEWACWLCHCWEAEVAEVLRTAAWSCSGLQMFSCEIVSEGRSGKLQSFLCLYLVLLAGANIQDQGSLRALSF